MMCDERPPWSPAAFERRYAEEADPWDFAQDPYERQRYRLTLEALGRARYRRAFEPGCSVGELTALLAERATEVLACDVSRSAVRRAARRCRHAPGVRVIVGDLRAPVLLHLSFDLIVLSEIGYYFDAEELSSIVTRLRAHLEPGGELLAVHWLGESPDHRLHGDEVHRLIHRAAQLERVYAARHPGFRLERWVRAP